MSILDARKLTCPFWRKIARRERDSHWNFMRRLARQGAVHVCLWNKRGLKERGSELMLSLMGGNDLMSWVAAHRSWFGYGAYNAGRTTFPFWLTPRGRIALRRRRRADDRAPIFGGMVQPGYQVIPFEYHRSLHEQRVWLRERAGLSRPAYIPDSPIVKPEFAATPRRQKRSRRAA